MRYKMIKDGIEKSLQNYIAGIDRSYSLKKISPVIYKNIKNFLARKGKRLRPVLFVIGYLGFAGKEARGLYRSALSLELLHDFMLIHDDIIDNSDLRRGLPSMHKMLGSKELAIVIGDMVYAMAVDTFLSIDENKARKESALKIFAKTAMNTGGGEFVELLYSVKDIDRIKKQDIYKIYDLKTAQYTFCTPLVIGATLAGAKSSEIKKLFDYGICLGRAFQIKDDILDIFGKESQTGKSSLTDIKESKKTLILWHAYKNSSAKDRSVIRRILDKDTPSRGDLAKMRMIIRNSGALNYADEEISSLLKKAKDINTRLFMKREYKEALYLYSETLLAL